MLTYVLFIIGFVILVKGADLLITGASSASRRLGVSDLVIGLTVVAFGTSAPELFVNLFAAYKGTTDVAIGNVIGSNIANLLLILGLAALIYPLKVTKGTIWKEIPLSLLAVVLVLIMTNDILVDNGSMDILTRSDGLALIAFFIIFLYYIFGMVKYQNGDNLQKQEEGMPWMKTILYIVGGLAGLIFGGQWIVGGAVLMAEALGMSQTLIGVSIIAVGTSLPELTTSVMAAWRKNSDIAIGNVVGSNIFNVFWVLGISSVLRPLPLSPAMNFDVIVAILASVLLFVWMFVGKKHYMERWNGALFLFMYVGYLAIVVSRG